MAMHRKGCYKMMDTKTYEWLKNIDEFSGVTYLLTCALFLTYVVRNFTEAHIPYLHLPEKSVSEFAISVYLIRK